MAEILDDVEKNSSTLIEIANEFDAALDVIGHPIPITNLANSAVDTSKSLVSEPPVTKLPAAVSCHQQHRLEQLLRSHIIRN